MLEFMKDFKDVGLVIASGIVGIGLLAVVAQVSGACDRKWHRWDWAAGCCCPGHIVHARYHSAVTRLTPEAGEDRGAARS